MASGDPVDPQPEDPPRTPPGGADPGPAPGTEVRPGPTEATAPSPATDIWAPRAQQPSSPRPAAPTAAPPAQKKRKKGRFAFLQELPFLLLVAFLLALLIKSFLVQAFYIPSESMEATLNVGDRVLVNKVVYHLHSPRRGDIIVFADPAPESVPHRNPLSAFWHWLTEGLGVSTSPEKDFIKRVVGLPGDLVECKNGTVFINGTPLREPYIKVEDDRPCGPTRVPADRLFVMGDNRLNSRDSRYGLGLIPYDKVIGRAFVIIWPPSRVGWLHGL